jgi:hypothetical protein
MALDAARWEIQNDKDIRYLDGGGTFAHGTAGVNYVTVIELHRWLQGLADDASQVAADDYMDISRDTPSDRSTDNIITLINGYNIDDTTAEYIFGGSIIQDEGNIIYDGILVYANKGMDMQVIQNGAVIANDFWNSIPDGDTFKGINRDEANGISHRFMLKVRTAGADIDGRRLITQTRVWGKTFSEFKINGTSRGNNVSALTYADDLNNQETEGNMTASPYSDIANDAEGYNTMDVNIDTVNEAYYSRWDLNGAGINDLYERIKYLTRQGSGSTLYGLNGELFRGITHELTYTSLTGTFDEGTSVTFGNGATAQVLADNGSNKIWVQLLTGAAPAMTDGTKTIVQASPDAANATFTAVAEKALSFPACGQSTGSALIGAYGFGVDNLDLAYTDSVIDLITGNPITPPNNVTFTMGNLVSGDRVLVAERGYRLNYDAETNGPFVEGSTLTFASPAGTAKLHKLLDYGTTGQMWIGPMLTGTVPADNSTITSGTVTGTVNGAPVNDINLGQLTLNGALSGTAVVAVVVSGAIPTDTPSTGTIRIKRTNGAYTRHAYTSYSGSTFTIGSTDFSTNTAANGANIFISYIDDASAGATMTFTGVYLQDRNLFFRVRNGGGTPKIKTSEGTGSLGTAGGSANASRISDE